MELPHNAHLLREDRSATAEPCGSGEHVIGRDAGVVRGYGCEKQGWHWAGQDGVG